MFLFLFFINFSYKVFLATGYQQFVNRLIWTSYSNWVKMHDSFVSSLSNILFIHHFSKQCLMSKKVILLLVFCPFDFISNKQKKILNWSKKKNRENMLYWFLLLLFFLVALNLPWQPRIIHDLFHLFNYWICHMWDICLLTRKTLRRNWIVVLSKQFAFS